MSTKAITKVTAGFIAAIVLVAAIVGATVWYYAPPAPTTVLTTLPTTIVTTKPTTVLTTLPTTIVTTKPTTVMTTLPTTIVTTVSPTVGPRLKLAAILYGMVTDADYQTLAYLTLQAVRVLGVDTAYSEKVMVPDTERVMREYIAAGYDIIWGHSTLYSDACIKLAREYPNVKFIAEADIAPKDPPPNLWWLERNFYIGFYILAGMGTMITKTGKIAYLGASSLPFSNAEVHAVQQAVHDFNPSVQLIWTFCGQFDDVVVARQAADAMISEGVDVIMSSLNLGNFGIFEALKAAPHKVYLTTKYTDKSGFAPQNYVSGCLLNFTAPLQTFILDIKAGRTGRGFQNRLGAGLEIQRPLLNVPPEIDTKVAQLVQDVKSGKIVPIFNTTKPS